MAQWEAELTGDTVAALEASLNAGPLLNDQGSRLLLERQVSRIGGLKVIIYSNEHPPPHFLVKCSEGSCRFTIADCEPMDDGLQKFIRNIKAWHKANRNLLISTWNESRPADCPVGEFRVQDP